MATGIQYGKLHLFPETKLLRVPLPAGDRGIAVTVGFMRQAAEWGQADPQIRQLALEIVDGVPNRDSVGEINAVYQWVKSNIAFRGELDETVQTPEVTIKFAAGDCDDHSVLVAALLGSIGYTWEFKTVAVNGQEDFTHVYAEIYDGNGQVVTSYDPADWIAMDTTVDEAYPGWQPGDVTRAATWSEGRSRDDGKFMRGYRTFRGLGDDGSDPTVGDQISQVISAATPLVTAFAPQPQPQQVPVYIPNYGVMYPGTNYSQTPGQQPIPQPPARKPLALPWGWIALGVGAFALFKMGESRGLRR